MKLAHLVVPSKKGEGSNNDATFIRGATMKSQVTDTGAMLYDERRMVMVKSKLENLDRQNKKLRKELNKKDSAFMKCADLCAFFSKILSNEYVTLQRNNGFKVPLGQSLIG